MPRKTIIIFISVFAIIGLLIFGVSYWLKHKNTTTEENPSSWYQDFNPFGSGSSVENDGGTEVNEKEDGDSEVVVNELVRFHKITDFAVSGATFLEDTRPVINTTDEAETPEQIKTVIDSATKEGKKEIQKILNETL
jgi:hypothetical protein